MTWAGYSETGQGSQERGPGSFANRLGPVAQASPVQVGGGGVQGGIRFIGNGTGGNIGNPRLGDERAPPVVSVQDKTLSMMMGLIQDKLAPKIKEETQRALLEGAARHASGVALEEIINEQPWYANVFGTAPAVEGARAYSIQSNVAKFVAEQAAAMDDMKTLPPEQVSAQLYERLQEYKTGDEQTDMMLQMELVGQVAPLIKAHTKAHVEYMQSKANEAHYHALVNVGEEYQRVSEDTMGLFTDEDRARYAEKLAQPFMLPQGRNPENHWRNAGKALIHHAASGNTHVLRAAMETGVIDALPPDTKRLVLEGFTKAAPAAFMRVAQKDQDMRTALLAFELDSSEMTPAQIEAVAEDINDRMSKLTGIPKEMARFFDVNDVMRTQVRAANQLEREQQRVQKELHVQRQTMQLYDWLDGKLPPDVDARLAATNVFQQLGLTEAQGMGGINQYLQGRPPEDAARVANRFHSQKIPHVTNLVDSFLARTSDTTLPIGERAAAMVELAKFRQGITSEVAAATHIPEEAAEELKVFTQLAGGNFNNAVQAMTYVKTIAKNNREARKLASDNEAKEAINDAIDKESKAGLFGSTPNDSTRNQIIGMVAPMVRAGVDPGRAVGTLLATNSIVAGGGIAVVDTDRIQDPKFGSSDLVAEWGVPVWRTSDRHAVLGAIREAAENELRGWAGPSGAREGGAGGNLDGAEYLKVTQNGKPVVLVRYQRPDNGEGWLAIDETHIRRLREQRDRANRPTWVQQQEALDAGTLMGENADASYRPRQDNIVPNLMEAQRQLDNETASK
jgi:hypothetical protein